MIHKVEYQANRPTIATTDILIFEEYPNKEFTNENKGTPMIALEQGFLNNISELINNVEKQKQSLSLLQKQFDCLMDTLDKLVKRFDAIMDQKEQIKHNETQPLPRQYLICADCLFELQQRWRETNEKPIKMFTRICGHKPECCWAYR